MLKKDSLQIKINQLYLIKKRERENLLLIKDKKLIHIQLEIELEGVPVIEEEIEGEVQALGAMIVEVKEILILGEVTEVFQEVVAQEVFPVEVVIEGVDHEDFPVEVVIEGVDHEDFPVEVVIEGVDHEDFPAEVVTEAAAHEVLTPEVAQEDLVEEEAVMGAEVEVEDDDGYITFN